MRAASGWPASAASAQWRLAASASGACRLSPLSLSLIHIFVFANLLVGTRYETLQVFLNNMRNSSGHYTSAVVVSYFVFVLVLTWAANRLNKDKA